MVVLLVAFAAATIGVALASSATTTHPLAAPSPKLPTLTPFKQIQLPYYGLEFIAQDAGFYKKYNLDVTFVPLTQQGVSAAQLVISGQVDTAGSQAVPTEILTRAAGAKIVAVHPSYVSDYGDQRFYSLKGSGITKASDLAGKRVGIVNLGQYSDYILQIWLYQNHVSLNDVQRVSIPLPSMCSALLNHQIDAIGMYSLYWKQCEGENPDKLQLLFRDDQVTPSAKFYTAYYFREDYIQQHPDVVRAFLAAINDAENFVKTNPTAATAIITKYTNIPAQYLVVPHYPTNCIDLVSAAKWVTLLANYNVIPHGSVGGTDWVSNKFNPGCPQTIKQQLALAKQSKPNPKSK
jgi:NitT/TauT family transport system substrate-binding protein